MSDYTLYTFISDGYFYFDRWYKMPKVQTFF